MNISTVDRTPQSALWEALYAPVAEQMHEVDALLKTELRNPYPYIDELIRHSFRLGGKRLRPALVLLTAKAIGEIRREHIILAAVVEMIHTATLLHDDVLDEAAIRRHLPTVNARWGNEASVLSGDYLFTHAFYLASTLDTTYGCRVIGKATNTVCEGELLQIESRHNFALGESHYYRIIEAKTAALCACCCQLGAYYAGADEELVASLTDFGRQLGLAFQIADDLLDVCGDEAATGKSLGTDLEKEKMTLPLIRLVATTPADDRDDLLALLASQADDKRARLQPYLDRSDAITYARDKAIACTKQARDRVASLVDSPAKDVLIAMTRAVVDRRQ